MPDQERPFRVRPGDHKLIQIKGDVVPPIAGFGTLIAPGTLLVSNAEADAPSRSLIGDVFDNVTIEFSLEPIGGAGAVDNDDNWGIGPDGLDAARFWQRGARGQQVRI